MQYGNVLQILQKAVSKMIMILRVNDTILTPCFHVTDVSVSLSLQLCDLLATKHITLTSDYLYFRCRKWKLDCITNASAPVSWVFVSGTAPWTAVSSTSVSLLALEPKLEAQAMRTRPRSWWRVAGQLWLSTSISSISYWTCRNWNPHRLNLRRYVST